MFAADKNKLCSRILMLEELIKEYPHKTGENILQQLKAISDEVIKK